MTWLSRVAMIAVAALLIGSAAADTGPAVPPRTVSDINALLVAGQKDGGRIEALKALLAQPAPATDDRHDLASYFWKRALALDEIGDERQALQAMQKVADNGWAWDGDAEMGYLSGLYMRIGNLDAARQVTLKRLEGSQEANICARGNLIGIYAKSDPAEAQRWLDINEATFNSRRSKRHNNGLHRQLGCLEKARAAVHLMHGQLVEAEAALRTSIAEFEEDMPLAAWRGQRNPGKESQLLTDGRKLDLDWGEVALVQARRNQLFEAEATMRQALRMTVEHHGSRSTTVVTQLSNYAEILAMQGRYAEAQWLARLAIDTLDQIGAPIDATRSIRARLTMAQLLVVQQRYTDAMAVYGELSQALVRLPEGSGLAYIRNSHHVLALIRTGRADDALAMLDQLLPTSQQWLGKHHFETAQLLALRGMAQAALGRRAEALGNFREALPMLLATVINTGDEPSPMRDSRVRLILETYLELLADSHDTSIEVAASIDASSIAFQLADALHSQRTQAAVSASAARAAAVEPTLGNDIRKEQDLIQEMQSLHQILRNLMNTTADQQLPRVMADMRTRIEAIRQEREKLQMSIGRRFPAYTNLIRPQPPSLTDARAALRPGEALINLFTTDHGTFIWAFRRDGPVAFARARLGGEKLAQLVQSLRRSLDPGDIDLRSGIPDFDLAAAYRLYAELILPVVTGWQGATQWLVAANGALGQLPLTVLPTTPVSVTRDLHLPYAQYRNVPWLVRQVAYTQIPSINALVTLRKLPPSGAKRRAFVGFGDPQFSVAVTEVASRRSRLRDLNIVRPGPSDIDQIQPAEWLDYSRLPPLPDTRDEILALAKVLNADPQADVFLGERASKDNLKQFDLSTRRVVAFATHGLLAGDFPGIAEPSLALANPGGGQNGLLTLEEILGLKMDADLVVLSACNTAGSDGQSADALSGLGRGFFYAGSRALLVTHWPVESVSARMLVTGMFERQAVEPTLSRAQALQQSMLALMQSQSPNNRFAYAHPLFWAPYTLIGDGGP